MKPRMMTSMEMDDDDIIDMATPMPIAIKDRATYPYGLRISLTDKEFDKLGIDTEDVQVGGTLHLHAMATITSVSRNEIDGRKSERVEIQIEKLEIECEDEENEDDEGGEDE